MASASPAIPSDPTPAPAPSPWEGLPPEVSAAMQRAFVDALLESLAEQAAELRERMAADAQGGEVMAETG